MTDLPSVDPESDPEEQKEVILDAARERKAELDKKQAEILETIQSEHGGDLIETPVNIAGDYTATVEVKLNGELTDKLGAIDERLEAVQEGDKGLYETSEAAEDASNLLDDIIKEAEYDKNLFMSLYHSEGLEAVGDIVQIVFEEIEQERKRRQGQVDGFRGE